MALVHVGHWLNQPKITQLTGLGFPLGLELKRSAGPPGEQVENTKADVMTGCLVFFTRIAETNDALETHARRLAGNCPCAKKNARSRMPRAF